MITLNYAKKVGDAYILNFFADSEEDIEKFDITKEFMFYGVPSAGSLITCVSKDSSTNYYVDKSGSLVKIDQDQPTPSLIPFNGDGTQYIAGYEFDTSLSTDEIKSILSKLSYEIGEGDAAQCMMVSCGETYGLVVLKVISTDDYYIAAVDDGNVFAIYGTKAGTIGEIPFAGGFENLTDGKYHFSNADVLNVTFVNNDEGWNGILIGAVEGEEPQPTGLTPFEVSDTISSFKVDTSMSAESISNIIQSVLTASGGESLVTVVKSHDEIADADYNLINFATNNGIYAISLLDGVPIYASDIIPGLTETAGWQSSITIEDTTYNLVDKNGVLNFEQLLQDIGGSTVDIPLNITELNGEGWNGVIIGKVTE